MNFMRYWNHTKLIQANIYKFVIPLTFTILKDGN